MKLVSYIVMSGFIGLVMVVAACCALMCLTSCSFNQIQTDTHGQSYDTVRESSHVSAETDADIPINPKL